MREIDFWLKTMVEGYVVKFATKSYQSYSKAEAVFNFELRGELIREVLSWIKMFLVEEGLHLYSQLGWKRKTLVSRGRT